LLDITRVNSYDFWSVSLLFSAYLKKNTNVDGANEWMNAWYTKDEEKEEAPKSCAKFDEMTDR